MATSAKNGTNRSLLPGWPVALVSGTFIRASASQPATHLVALGAGPGGIVSAVDAGPLDLTTWEYAADSKFLVTGATYVVSPSGLLVKGTSGQLVGTAASKTRLSVNVSPSISRTYDVVSCETGAVSVGPLTVGTGFPSPSEGKLGDYRFDLSRRTIYGPKTDYGWGSPTGWGIPSTEIVTPPATISFIAFAPDTFDLANWTPAGWSTVLIGTGFTADMATGGTTPLVLQFDSQDEATSWVVNAVTFINSTTLGVRVGVLPSIGTPSIDLYDVTIQDAGATLLPVAVVLTGAARVVNNRPNNDIWNSALSAPASLSGPADPLPANQSLPCLWHGSTDTVNYDTLYAWNTNTTSWVAVISA